MRMQEILLAALGGASIEYTARVTESVLARLHFVIRMPTGEALSEVEYAPSSASDHGNRSWMTSWPTSWLISTTQIG